MRLRHVPYFTVYTPTLSWTSASTISMEKILFSSFIFLVITFGVQAQMPDTRINWNPTPLTWQDFSGEPDPANRFHANTNTGISYSWSMKQIGEEVEFIYDVRSFFIPEKSWVKPGKTSDHLLVHEQLHFDISELHARKLRKAMYDFDVKKEKNIKPALQAIYKRTEGERHNMQKKFDAETRHSMNVEAQLKWQNYIQEELKKLEEFSS